MNFGLRRPGVGVKNAVLEKVFESQVKNALLIHLCLWSLCLGLPAGLQAQKLSTGPLLSAMPETIKARVVFVQDARATIDLVPQRGPIEQMLERGIIRLAGTTNAAEAWRKYVSPRDVVGLKVYCAPGPGAGTRPAVVGAVINQLLNAGVPAENIVVWDKHLAHLKQTGMAAMAGRQRVSVAGAEDEGWDEKVFYETALLGQLYYGDLEFQRKGEGVGRKSYVSKLLTHRLTKIINIPPMLNHYKAGVTGNLFSLATGSVDNTRRFEDSERLASAIPEIYALPEIGDKVVLNIVDALMCQYEGEMTSLLHYSVLLNQLRLSTDPVALDVLSLHELMRERDAAGIVSPKFSMELFQNASLLELGISDVNNIQVDNVSTNDASASPEVH